MLEFVRLVDGRLWHVVDQPLVTVCGRSTVTVGARVPEVLAGIVPSGAWVCRRCRGRLADRLRLVDMAIAADPRTRVLPQPLPGPVSQFERFLECEAAGQPRTRTLYACAIREFLHPWGRWPHLNPGRLREIES